MNAAKIFRNFEFAAVVGSARRQIHERAIRQYATPMHRLLTFSADSRRR
jgi:hypothetical protein